MLGARGKGLAFPGPMVEQPGLGLQRLRVCVDSLPSPWPGVVRLLPAPVLPLFAMKIPEMIIPWADAASANLAHARPGDPSSTHRVGVARPAGMKGRKGWWAAKPRNSVRRRLAREVLNMNAGADIGRAAPAAAANPWGRER